MADGNASASHLAFEKLDGRESYNNWKFGMKMALIHENLWYSIEGYPVDETPTEKEKTRKDQKALAKICLMVKPSAYAYVRSAETAEEAWKKLQKAYEDKGLSRRLSLLRTLAGIKLQNFRNMEQYVNEILSVSQKLADMDAALDDEFVAVIMLNGLTSDYDPMVMALESANVTLTSDFVKAKLLQDNKYSNSPASGEQALYSKNNRNFHKKKPVICYKCQKEGHYRSNCPTNIANKNENKHKEKVVKNQKQKKALYVALNTSCHKSTSDEWYIDSGATTHLCVRKEWLKDFEQNGNYKVTVANNESVTALGIGNAIVSTPNGQKTISNVVCVPELKTNLLSVSKMVENGHTVIFDKSGCKIYDDEDCKVEGVAAVTASKSNGLYRLDVSNEETVCTVEGNNNKLWHRRLGHLNRVSMNMLKYMATGINLASEKGEPCIACLQGKQTRIPFRNINAKRAKSLLQIVHSDLCGPMPEISWGGAKYILTFIDDFSRKIFVYFLKSKDEVFPTFKNFQALVENQTNHTIKVLRTDNGGEYINKQFEEYLKLKGIRHQLTVPHTPEQNGVAERTNRTIVEKARTLLQDAGCEKRMWAESINAAVYLKNRSPHKAVKDKTPEEVWTGEKVNLGHLRVFGCIAYVHVPKVARQKWDAKGKPYIFTGYCEETKGYRLFDPEEPGKIIKARDVIFLEDKFTLDEVKSPENMSNNTLPYMDAYIDENEETENENLEINISHEENEQASRYPKRQRVEKDFSDYELYHTCCEPNVPTTFKEAVNGEDNDRWKKAIQAELKSMEENKAWILVDPPQDKKIIQNKWVFSEKRNSFGDVVRHKARLVAKGFTQEFGVDYCETFSPVVRNSSLRTLFALAAELDLSVEHLDVDTAFLNGELSEQIYMYQPEGFVDPKSKDKVCLLKKAIYGLKQSSRIWNKKITNVLLNLGYKKSDYESCVFFKNCSNHITVIAIYVDDFLIFTNDTHEKEKLKSELSKIFRIKDLGEIKRCLGLNIERDELSSTIRLNQKHYILNILSKFNMLEAKSISTPMEINFKASNETEDANVPYQQLIGALMYLAVNSRPDIAYVISFLSQFNNNPKLEHWKCAKRVLRYLKGTLDYCLVYKKANSINVTGYTDADWANDINDRKSYTGFVFKLANGAISWEARKQRSVALSSTEAEYVAISESVKEAIFLKGFINEIVGCIDFITIYNDNQSAQKLVYNPVFHNRTKHIDVKYHFVRKCVEDKEINVKYLSTDKMIADIFTKPLCQLKHNFCVNGLGL